YTRSGRGNAWRGQVNWRFGLFLEGRCMPFVGTPICRFLLYGALISAGAVSVVQATPPVHAVQITQASVHAGGETQERGYIARRLHTPVPGGVAVISLGSGSQAPVVHYGESRVMVVRDSNDEWVALVGIDLKAKTGRQEIKVDEPSGSRTLTFEVGHKEYASQHIKLKKKAYVTPDPEQLKRYEREY